MTTVMKNNVERRMISSFMNEFFSKFGYYPTVVTKQKIVREIDAEDNFPMLSLNQLSECFTPFLPVKSGIEYKLTSKLRFTTLVQLRFVFYFIARAMGYSLTDIGNFLGGKDHSSVIYGLTTFRNLYETSSTFRTKYNTIANYIKSKHESPDMECSYKEYTKPESDLSVKLS